MRYFYEKPSYYTSKYGSIYHCDHPVYYRATLYLIGRKGLCVIQQRYDDISKHTYWTEIDPWLVDDIYKHPKFYTYFNKYAGEIQNGLYPTVSVRQLMYGLRMKPMRRESWETLFDHTPI